MKKLLWSFLLCISLSYDVLYALEPVKRVSVYGCVTQGYLKSDANNYLVESEDGSFELREMLLTFSSELNYNIHVGAQFAAIDLGNVGNNEPVLDWAFSDVQFFNFFGMRAGRIKGGGIGFYNETQDIDVVRTGIFLPASVYNPLLRDSHLAIDGISIYGNISFPYRWLGSISYCASVGTTPVKSEGATYKYIENVGLLKDFDITLGDTYLASVAWSTPSEGMKIGVSYLYSKIEAIGTMNLHPAWFKAFDPFELFNNFDFENVGEIIGMTMDQAADLKVKNPMELQIDPHEMYVCSFEYIGDNLTIASEVAASYNTRRIFMNQKEGAYAERSEPLGGYLAAAYRFSEWLEIGLCYDMYFSDKDDMDGEKQVEYYNNLTDQVLASIEGFGALLGDEQSTDEIFNTVDALFKQIARPDYNAWQHMATLTGRFDISENLVFKLEYSAVNGTALVAVQDNKIRETPELNKLKENWNIFAAKVIFVF